MFHDYDPSNDAVVILVTMAVVAFVGPILACAMNWIIERIDRKDGKTDWVS
jgi:hypothetical protein